jgi:MFS family permease
MDEEKTNIRILVFIVLAQFCATSLWFAVNAIIPELTSNFHLTKVAVGYLTSAVQIGFIIGTLIFAIFNIADRFPSSKVFVFSALCGSLINLSIIHSANNMMSLCIARMLIGFSLAGIYPVGMKIASDYFKKGLGVSLGFLVGALVLGTALPHLIRAFFYDLPWKFVIYATSSLSLFGGLIIWLFVPIGPYSQNLATFNLNSAFRIFGKREFRSAALGYFGHMWELYAFWAFTPIIIETYNNMHPISEINVSIWSFIIIGIGGIACVISGFAGLKYGAKKLATISLFMSCLCCICSPVFFQLNSTLFLSALLFWGMVVIADSPLFSSLVAQNAPSDKKGTALTIVNCIGFATTIISIQLISRLLPIYQLNHLLVILSIGPIVGIISLKKDFLSYI